MDKVHRATYKTPTEEHGLIVPKRFPTVPYQCSILFKNMGSFKRQSEFRKAENIDKPVSPNLGVQRHQRPSFVTSRRILERQQRACDLDGRG